LVNAGFPELITVKFCRFYRYHFKAPTKKYTNYTRANEILLRKIRSLA